MKIVIDEKIPFIKGVFERWADVVYSPGSKISPLMVADADALIVRTRTKCNEDLLKGSKVRIVASATIGFDHIDTMWLENNGIHWANAPGCNSGSVMQYITSLLFFLAEKHNLDLRSVTLGVVGVGNVGSKVEKAARAVGMRVLLNDPPRQRREESPEIHLPGSMGDPVFHPLHELLQESDILTLHVPLTRRGEDRTYHLLDEEKLSMMKPNAILINTSRGEVVDNPALREALRKGRLQGAALDVWEDEPAADPQLVDLTDIATPHIAGYSVDGKANATISSVRIVARKLGLPLTDWLPAELPEPEEPLIDLRSITDIKPERTAESNYDDISGRRGNRSIYQGETCFSSPSSLDQVAAAVRHTYPIEKDDFLFRNSRENFEYLRDNYRIRREFGSYSVLTDDTLAAGIMSDLGFIIIKRKIDNR
jgi:erythronate-4-phosphate dehydrogenase